ncbi:MAG: hypothetical protein RLO51_18000 [Thalassobaculum sp.]|uniref:hypothetical protein n=1 Tax=Thalassobaculum sp. TaxID=2022740 RepID=UPI0032EBF27F
MSMPHRLLARLVGPVIIGVGLLWGAAPAPVRADAFVDGFEDLPLMPGLRNVPAASVSFDAAVGRIVVAFAEGAVRMPAVRAFYTETLPQLGWKPEGADRWLREGEVLTLDTVVEGNGLVVRFELAPR